jgi:hypothetical protein
MNLFTGVIARRAAKTAFIPAGARAAAALAVALTRRHDRQPFVARADFALARPAFFTTLLNQHFPRISLAQNLTLRHQSLFPPAAKTLPQNPSATARFGAAEASALFQNFLARQARVSALVPTTATPFASATAAQTPSLQQQTALKIPRELPKRARQPQDSAPSITAAMPPPALREQDFGGPRLVPPPPPPPTILPAPEIKRVAAQVMHEIEHRLTANRERLGRR